MSRSGIVPDTHESERESESEERVTVRSILGKNQIKYKVTRSRNKTEINDE